MSKIKGRFIKKRIIFISLIVSMSVIGIGYASWNDGTKLELTMKTGFIRPVFDLVNSEETFDDGDLSFSLSNDKRTLTISGKVYKSFNKDLTIRIVDEGSIPSVFNSLDKQDENISKIPDSGDYIESFEITIKPDIDNDTNYIQNDGLSELEQQISNLIEEINQYSSIEKYDFEYILNFEQGL